MFGESDNIHISYDRTDWLDEFDYVTGIGGGDGDYESESELYFFIIAPNRSIAKARLREALRKWIPHFRKITEDKHFTNDDWVDVRRLLARNIEPASKFKEDFLSCCSEDLYMEIYRNMRAVTPYVYDSRILIL